MNPCVYLVLLNYIQISYAANYKLSDEEYELMPPIVNLDPFETCLREPGGRYCTAHVNFVADGFSPLLNQIQEFSESSASHFNHTRSIYGVCMTHCGNFNNSYTVDQGNSLEACLNDSLWIKYNLKVRVEEDIRCFDHNEKRQNVGAVDMAVVYIVLGLVACNAIGSLIDVIWTKRDHGPVAHFLLCFSVPRNWKKLNASPQCEDPRKDSLKGFYGTRTMSMMLVIMAHSGMPAVVLPENPKFIEEQYDVRFNHIFLNGTLIMQNFLFLSAFLLVHTFLIYAEKKDISWRMLLMGILLRWLRLTPPYALVLAVIATWVRYFGTGPIWNMAVVEEAEDCRRYWWQHLLYINNYVDNSRCMPQSWYVAADTQLYCLAATILVLCRSPRSRNLVTSTLFVIGLIIPALLTYYKDLDGHVIASPALSAKLFSGDKTFNTLYKRGHTNIASYMMGMAFGYLVYNLQRNNFDASKYRQWRPVYWLLLVTVMCMLMCCKSLYEGPRVALIYRVLMSIFMKPIFELLIALTITGMIFKIENVYRGILEWRGWTPLARVSYSAYLLHMPLIRVYTGMQTYPIRLSGQRLIVLNLFSVVTTYIAATLFWLTVEAPLAQLMKKCFSSKPNPRSGNGDVQKTEVGPDKIHEE